MDKLWIVGVLGTIALVVLKIMGIIAIPWGVAFLPILITAGITMVLLIIRIALVNVMGKFINKSDDKTD